MQASSKLDEFNISRLPVTAESLDSRGLYIYDDGLRFVIWFGKMLPPDIAMNLLGEDFATDFSRVCFFIHGIYTSLEFDTSHFFLTLYSQVLN